MKKLLKQLKSMYLEGGEGNFLQITEDPYYIQVIGGKKAPNLFIDAVSDAHLNEDEFLSDEQKSKILALGFEIEPRSENFSKEMPFSEDKFAEIDETIIKVLEVYGVDPYKAEFELELD